MLRFPDGGLLHVVREVQELPQEPCFCLISEASRGKSPSLSPSPRGSCCSFSFHCLPWSKGEDAFLSPTALSPKQCCHAALTLLLSALNWLQALPSHQPGTRSQTTCCFAPPELDFKRRLVSSHDAGSDSGWDGCVYVGFRTLIAHFTPSNLYSLLWFKRTMSHIKSPQLTRR